MLKQLEEFRNLLDETMLKAMHKSVLLYGYESYTGRFIKWYAEYYHNIKIDWLVSTDMSRGRAYDTEIFRPSILEFDYQNVKDAFIWVVEPMTNDTKEYLEQLGYVNGVTYYDFYKIIYGNDIVFHNKEDVDVFNRRKEGKRDIQFLEWLEFKYDCNFVTRISKADYEVEQHNSGYGCTTQKEIFTILDRCHIVPGTKDAIFDYGCGKGAALVSFLDYGFTKAGGVEYEKRIYDVLINNIKALNLENYMEVFCDDARNIKSELDNYSWFYFYLPFDNVIFQKCVENICESYRRSKRKIRIVNISPFSKDIIINSGVFRLSNQFTIDLRQRVVHVYETYE